MKKILSSYSWGNDGAILILRIALGAVLMTHGYGKLAGYDQILPNFPDLIGIGGKLSFHLVIFAELICAFLVLIGLLTRFAVIPILIAMAVACFKAHAGAPFSERELSCLFLLLGIAVFITGGGRYSLDRMIFKR